MKTKFMLFLFLAVSFVTVSGCTQCVDFEPPLAIGTTYGPPAFTPGAVVFTTNGIPVSVHNFISAAGGSTFGVAKIAKPPYPFGTNQVINTNNINLGFDFSNIGFIPSTVKFEFLDLGGIQNLSVNGSPIFTGRLSSAPNPIGGAAISVSMTPLTGSVNGSKGTVVLTGQVKELKIGGQEFWIDNVCAINKSDNR